MRVIAHGKHFLLIYLTLKHSIFIIFLPSVGKIASNFRGENYNFLPPLCHFLPSNNNSGVGHSEDTFHAK